MKKIAVIFGGTSSEKEVSLHTGLAVIEAIKNIYDVTAINLEGDFHDLHSKLFDIDVVFNALVSEGVPIGNGYANLHLLPMYQNKIAYGSKGFPWIPEIYKGKVKYDKGICPVAEGLNDNRYMGIAMCAYEYSNKEIDSIIFAFKKVWDNIEVLK